MVHYMRGSLYHGTVFARMVHCLGDDLKEVEGEREEDFNATPPTGYESCGASFCSLPLHTWHRIYGQLQRPHYAWLQWSQNYASEEEGARQKMAQDKVKIGLLFALSNANAFQVRY